MSFFQQSSGKYFVQSPGKQRDAGSNDLLAGYTQAIFFNERTAAAASANINIRTQTPWSIFPTNPDFTREQILESAIGFRVRREWYREQDRPNFVFPTGYNGTYTRYYGDSRNNTFGGGATIGTPITPGATFDSLELGIENSYKTPLLSANIAQFLNPLFTAPGGVFLNANKANVQIASFDGLISYYGYYPEAEIATNFIRPESFSAMRARFRTSFSSQGWIGRFTRQESVTVNEFASNSFSYQATDFRFIQSAPVASGVWNEVPNPLSFIDNMDSEATVRNHFYFWIYAETPAQWQARTGITLAGL